MNSSPDNGLTQPLAQAVEDAQAGRTAQAEEFCRNLLLVHPHHPDAMHLLGLLAHRQQRHAEAVSWLRQAAQAAPDAAFIHSNLGLALMSAGRGEEAVASLRRAIALAPEYAEAHFNLGVALHAQARREEAIARYREALCLKPGYADARWNLCCVELETGDYLSGWRDYQACLDRPEIAKVLEPFRADPAPEWDGAASLEGRSLVVYPECGFGDIVMFVRYVALLRELGARVVLLVPQELERVCTSLEGVTQIVPFSDSGIRVPRCDYKIALFGLPRVFGTTPHNIPARVPYLSADAGLVATWRERLDAIDAARRPRIGLVWAGRPDHALEPRRTVPLELLASLADKAEVQLVSLQMGPATSQLASLSAPIAELGPEIRDFADTAAIIQGLDLLISSDTSTAHLAGAIGANAWILLHHPCDWRWALGGQKSPWYPTLRLFRQRVSGDWSSVLMEVAQALARFDLSH